MSKLLFKCREYYCSKGQKCFSYLCNTLYARSVNCIEYEPDGGGFVNSIKGCEKCFNACYRIAYRAIITDEYKAMFYNGVIELNVNNTGYDCESLSIDGEPAFEEEMEKWNDEQRSTSN